MADIATPIAGGYYGPGYRETGTTRDRRRVNEYIAGIKHALLFMPKLALADHMVVNAPNFRIAYHTSPEFRELFRGDRIEVAHFERFKGGGPHFDLVTLRRFYAGNGQKDRGRFHAQMPEEFQTPEFDDELRELHAHTSRSVADSDLRDPLFTRLAREKLESEALKPLFGRQYNAYAEAFRRMMADNAVLGIVHLDSARTFKEDRNVFDYMADFGSVGSREQLIDKYGLQVGRAHRALIARIEIELLDQSLQPVLPPELEDYRTWVRRTADLNDSDPSEREEVQIELDLSPASIPALASLRYQEILDLRKTEESQAYFRALDLASNGKIAFTDFVTSVHQYLTFLAKFFSGRPYVADNQAGRVKGRLKAVRRLASGKDIREAGTSIVFQIISWICSTYFVAAPVVLGQAGKVANAALERFAPAAPVTQTIESRLELYRAGDEREGLLQYEEPPQI